jgi:hypothetical protein
MKQYVVGQVVLYQGREVTITSVHKHSVKQICSYSVMDNGVSRSFIDHFDLKVRNGTK